MRFEFSIRKDLWEKLSDKWINRVLCIECFLEELEDIEPNQKFYLSDFAFLGVVGDHLFGGILLDDPNVITQ